MEQVLALPEYEVFQAISIEMHRKYWQDDDIWGIIKSYPSSIRTGFEDLKETFHEYIANGYSDRIQRHYRLDERFLRKFYTYISETECLEKSFARAGGIKYEFGLEWGKLKILKYYRRYLKNPPSETGFFYYFKRDCKQGSLEKYGISCWGDLLEISLQDYTFFQRDRQNLSGYMGLKRAKTYLQKQYKMYGKIPTSYESGSKLIAKAIHRNFWVDFGITTWGDLIFEVFGYIKGTMNLWKGSGGLDRALSWIKEFVNEHGKLPNKNSAHYSTIKGLANNKFWMKYGINNWDDLTLKASGIVDLKKRRKSWTGIKGFERARNELKKYFNDHQKLPTSAAFSNIVKVIIKGYWKEQNISSWNDLLRVTFGKVNVIQKIWTGEEGLNRAKKELQNYFKVHQKLPTSTMFLSINKSISRGYWKEQNISSWNDLLRNIFGKVNVTCKIWIGQMGLERAKIELEKFFIDHQKLPAAMKFSSIYAAIKKGYWKEYNISSWNDLLRDIFGKVNVTYKTRIGQLGLDRSKNELKKYFNDHQKLPTSTRFSYLCKVIIKGYWKEYNIRSWNDLLNETFGRVN